MSRPDRVDLRGVYLYLVCLVTLVLAIFATVSAVRNTVQLVYPDPGAFAYEPAVGPKGEAESPEARSRREQAVRDSQRQQAVVGLVGSGTMLLIAGPAYAYHWRRVQAEQAPRAAMPAGGDGGPGAG